MDIAALAVIKNQVQLKQDVGMAVMKKAMGAAEQKGSLVNQMLDKMAEGRTESRNNLPHIGNKLDLYV
ncbi:hypothetical protein JOC37_002473 [Desulfohalotomaculum tongense]|uniref:YjfB family protein n=1 Tax=Desulforadius tongensis TaxID=1216062 RepID=UPI00195887CC|nr:YjfB family protein [Desulforadius tongensis]MBM7856048.1 hypothetical protein [Desulforadius tongensis]